MTGLSAPDRVQATAVERHKGEQVLQYMLRPNMSDCWALWFGKSDHIDREIGERFGADVAAAAEGRYDHWALDLSQPRLLVALVILLDQFPRHIHRHTARMYASDARCQALVRQAMRAGVTERLSPVEQVFLCLVLTHSESLDDQRSCMEAWHRVAAGLAKDDPLHDFGDIFERHLAVIRRFGRFPHRNHLLQRASTAAEEAFLYDRTFRFDLPLVRQPCGDLAFVGSCGR